MGEGINTELVLTAVLMMISQLTGEIIAENIRNRRG